MAQHDDNSRYHRQMLLSGIGDAGQQRLRQSRVLLVGCGALGCVIADQLARAGVGTLRIVDRDVVELTNLQRQSLFDEDDAAAALPKAEAARRRLAAINSACEVQAVVDDFNAASASQHVTDMDIILDGLDNFPTRYLLNDIAVQRGLPYIYGGAVATTGTCMSILPHSGHRRSGGRITWPDERATACLRCIAPEMPGPGGATCDTVGVLGPLATIIGAYQAAQAIKVLSGNVDCVNRKLLSIDLWSNHMRETDMSHARRDDCPCCGCGSFAFLEARDAAMTSTLCGRDAVQINLGRTNEQAINLSATAERLRPHGSFTHTPMLLRGEFNSERSDNGAAVQLMLFPNGRAIFKGVSTANHARTLYDRYIGT